MPEYDSGKTHSSYSGGEITRHTSARMRRLRERKKQKSKLDPDKQTTKQLLWESKLTTQQPIHKETQFQPTQQDLTTEEEKPLTEETPVYTEEQKIAALTANGEQVYKEQDYQSAYSIFTQVVLQQPDNSLARFYLGVSAAETGKFIEAIEHTQKLIESGAFTAQATYYQGLAYEKLGDKEKAKEVYHLIIQGGGDIPAAKEAFMRLEEERLLGRFSSSVTPIKDENKTKKNSDTSKERSKSSTPVNSRSIDTSSSRSNKSQRASAQYREDNTFNQRNRFSKSVGTKREDTTFNQSGLPSRAVETKTTQTANKQGAFNKTTKSEQLDVEELTPAQKLGEAVIRSASALPAEVAEEIKAIFTPATLASMVSVFAIYAAAHATGIGQAMDIGMLIAGGVFFGLDAFTIFKDIAGFAGAVNAKRDEDLDKAGQHLASAIAKIGVDAVMTLLTKKVADEVGKSVDHVNQVDEVSAHSDEVSPGRTETDKVQRNEPSQIDGDSSFLSGLDKATSDSLNSYLSGLTDAQKSQYLDIAATDVVKSQKLLEFGNFGSPERFRNVLNALESVDDIERLKRIFKENYLNSLSSDMRRRYQELLEEIASSGSVPSPPQHLQTLVGNQTFRDHLEVLEQASQTKRTLENQLTSEVYNDYELGGRNVAFGSIELNLPNGQRINEEAISISGKKFPQQINGRSPNHQIDNKRIVPPPNRGDNRLPVNYRPRGGHQDSERKMAYYILEQIEARTGISVDPLNIPEAQSYNGFSGKITIYSEMSPCTSCADILTDQLDNLFGEGNIKVEVKYGVVYRED